MRPSIVTCGIRVASRICSLRQFGDNLLLMFVVMVTAYLFNFYHSITLVDRASPGDARAGSHDPTPVSLRYFRRQLWLSPSQTKYTINVIDLSYLCDQLIFYFNLTQKCKGGIIYQINESIYVIKLSPVGDRSVCLCRLTFSRHIVQTEGTKALFKGLGPNIVGVAPSRAIYFCTYSQAKAILNQNIAPDTPIVHLSAASAAGKVYILRCWPRTL